TDAGAGLRAPCLGSARRNYGSGRHALRWCVSEPVRRVSPRFVSRPQTQENVIRLACCQLLLRNDRPPEKENCDCAEITLADTITTKQAIHFAIRFIRPR